MTNKSDENPIGVDFQGKNVVLIIADTLTALHLPTYGYERDTAPFLTELAKNNTYFRNAYSNAPWTVPSHASLFTGKLPSEHGCNTGKVIFDRKSFVEDLSNRGYNTVGISANELISEQLNFDKGFDSFHEVFNFESSNSTVLWKVALEKLRNPDLETFEKGIKFLYNKITGSSNMGAESIEKIAKKEIKSENSPNFLFINYTEPHLPYNSPKEYAGKFTDNPEEKISRNMKDHYNTEKPDIYYQGFPNCTDEELVDLYDGTIRYLDSKLEKLYKFLTRELEDMVFIVTSDHGENFGEHGAYFHQCGIWEKSVRIPMIIAGEGVKDQEIEDNYSLRNLKHLVLKNEVKTTSTVFAEYAGGKKMNHLKEEQKEEIKDEQKRKYSYNKSKCIIGHNQAIVKNSELEAFQFIPDQRCYSENKECFDDTKKIEKKLDLILGDFN